MAVFGGTFKSVIENAAALLKGLPLEDREYWGFHKSLARICLLFFTSLYTVETIKMIIIPVFRDHITWTWLDLLINYQTGFVRRGLLGEILFQLQPIIPSFVVAAVFIFCSYLLFTHLVIKFLNDTPLLVFLFFIFSPGSLLFPIYGDSVFGRKEIFALCAFALSLSIYTKELACKWKVCIFLALYTIATLIHECALFFAPLAACLLIYSIDTHNKRFRSYLLCALYVYFILLGCLLIFSINYNCDQSRIALSWSPYFHNIDPKAYSMYLDKGLGTVLAETKRKAINFNAFTGPFLIDFCWAVLPIILLLLHTTHVEFFRTLRKNEPLLFFSTIISLLIPFFLFCFQDWGRWIYLIAVQTFLFLIMLNNFGLVAYRRISPITGDQWRIYIVFLLYYAILWGMPHIR